MFNIRMGIPEMKEFWDDLEKKIKNNVASKKGDYFIQKTGKLF